jgi:hypothetical protein
MLDVHEGVIGRRALAALGGGIIVSGRATDGNAITWKRVSGERLGEAVIGRGVYALPVLDEGRFVTGTGGGDVVFYTHHGGRGVEEAARIAGAHSDRVSDFSGSDGRLSTASHDKTAAV